MERKSDITPFTFVLCENIHLFPEDKDTPLFYILKALIFDYCLWARSLDAQGILLALCSGITYGII